MTPPRLLVIQHNLDDGLNELGAPLADAGLYIDVWDTRLTDMAPHPVEDYDGVLSLGGTSSAAQEAGRPELTAERVLLTRALELGMPILGLCFGAQILARAAGGTVLVADRSEVGWCPIDLDEAAHADPLLQGVADSVTVFQYHYDTFTLPDDACVLARNGEMLQAYRLGANAWGLQFHLEVNAGQVYGWLGTYADDMTKAGVDLDELRAITAEYGPAYRELTWRLGGHFAAEVIARHERRRRSHRLR